MNILLGLIYWKLRLFKYLYPIHHSHNDDDSSLQLRQRDQAPQQFSHNRNCFVISSFFICCCCCFFLWNKVIPTATNILVLARGAESDILGVCYEAFYCTLKKLAPLSPSPSWATFYFFLYSILALLSSLATATNSLSFSFRLRLENKDIYTQIIQRPVSKTNNARNNNNTTSSLIIDILLHAVDARSTGTTKQNLVQGLRSIQTVKIRTCRQCRPD